jgi:hypothetical protein
VLPLIKKLNICWVLCECWKWLVIPIVKLFNRFTADIEFRWHFAKRHFVEWYIKTYNALEWHFVEWPWFITPCILISSERAIICKMTIMQNYTLPNDTKNDTLQTRNSKITLWEWHLALGHFRLTLHNATQKKVTLQSDTLRMKLWKWHFENDTMEWHFVGCQYTEQKFTEWQFAEWHWRI